jgi:hypothetical protein
MVTSVIHTNPHNPLEPKMFFLTVPLNHSMEMNISDFNLSVPILKYGSVPKISQSFYL